MRKNQNVCICTFSKYLFYILLEYFLADFHYYYLQQLQRESRAGSLTHQYPYPILHIPHPISLGPWHVHCRMCLHLRLLRFIDESRKPKLMMPRCPRCSRPCGVARSKVELPCCSRCCRRQMAKIYSKLRRSCIL